MAYLEMLSLLTAGGVCTQPVQPWSRKFHFSLYASQRILEQPTTLSVGHLSSNKSIIMIFHQQKTNSNIQALEERIKSIDSPHLPQLTNAKRLTLWGLGSMSEK
jgi:hypothetical protein